MELTRLGSLHPYRLSFMRLLVRKMMTERWVIEATLVDLDERGDGTVVYTIHTAHGVFSFVVFAHELPDCERSDRVIAERWDMTATLCEGHIDKKHLALLRENVPLQEAGRLDARSLVLTRANRSARNFDAVVSALVAGRQPGREQLARVGYLYRTTAVYGSGKFGMADWAKVHTKHPDFAQPFAAEMFSCYMIRHFSLAQAQHRARCQAPQQAVSLAPAVQRYFGIGNATGLGMAPYLINHPLLIDRWISVRESALARVVHATTPDARQWRAFDKLLSKAAQHLREISTDNAEQCARDANTRRQLETVRKWIDANRPAHWRALMSEAERSCSVETQELLNSLVIELYPELVDDLAARLAIDEFYDLAPAQPLKEALASMQAHYDWALAIDFAEPVCDAVFWYRSAEKMEPRLGSKGADDGEDKQMRMAVARAVRECHDLIVAALEQHPRWRVADFLIRHPQQRDTLRRIQTMAGKPYGDIRANLADADVHPIDLLRCKLSFFGVSKFDPKSRLWVRNTMFQGAPIVDDIGGEFLDDWYFPVLNAPCEDDARPAGDRH